MGLITRAGPLGPLLAAEVQAAAKRLEKAENDAMERTVALTSSAHSYFRGLTKPIA